MNKPNRIRWGLSNTYVHLSVAEVQRLLEVAKAHSSRNWLAILTMYLHGLRVSELTGLDGNSIQGDNLRVQRLKHGFLNTQPLYADEDPLWSEAEPMKALARMRPGVVKLFGISRSQVFRIVQGYCQQLGFPEQRQHPHILRHSVAMHSIDSVGIHRVRQFLGQRSISSTAHYLRASDIEASAGVFSVLKLKGKKS